MVLDAGYGLEVGAADQFFFPPGRIFEQDHVDILERGELLLDGPDDLLVLDADPLSFCEFHVQKARLSGPQFLLGYMGMPRRYHVYPPEFQVLNVLSSAGASILGLGYVIPGIYFIWSLWYGEQAGANPWGATGLEWQTSSPPPTENFEVTPVVTREAYDYTPTEEVVHVG